MAKNKKEPTRKRTINKIQWKKNIEKQNRHKAHGPVQLPNCNHDDDHKYFKCGSLQLPDVQKFYKLFYFKPEKMYQDNFILRFVRTKAVQRHRLLKGSPSERSSKYFIKNIKGELVPVCLNTFLRVLKISRHRINGITRQDFWDGVIVEKRGGFRKKDVYQGQENSIVQFLEKLEFTESHYCRGKSVRKYLPPELNINKLFQMYLEETNCKDIKKSYFYFIFNTKFNFGFGSPRTDVCSTCLSYQEKIKAEKDLNQKQQLQSEYEIHKKRAKSFFGFLHPPQQERDGSEILDDTLILSFDCEKNLQLLRVPDSAAYYSRNVYLYNFTIVQGNSKSQLSPNNVVSYCWTENEFPKNANIIASCILYHLNHTELTHYKHIRLVADGCAAQNKNSIVVTALLKWFNDYAPKNIIDIQLIFPVTGHSFLPPDRVFAQIEKQIKKKDTIINPDDYLEIIKRFACIRKVGVEIPVFNVKEAMNKVIKPCSDWNFSISQVKRIQFRKSGSNIELKGELFYEYDTAKFLSSYCKRGKKLKHLDLTKMEPRNSISMEKKTDLAKLLTNHFGEDWRAIPSLTFFIYLLDVAVIDEEVTVDDETCTLFEENTDLIV